MASEASEEWVRLMDPVMHFTYYANMVTRATCWECPPELGGDLVTETPRFVRLARGWYQYEDETTGRFYYYNNRTRETVWKFPAEARPPAAETRDASAFGGSCSANPGDEEETDDEDDDEEEEAPLPERDTSQLTIEKGAKRAARRLKILEEVLLSERTYVQALHTLKKVYLLPLRTVADQPSGKGQIFSHQDLDDIFLNIE